MVFCRFRSETPLEKSEIKLREAAYPSFLCTSEAPREVVFILKIR